MADIPTRIGKYELVRRLGQGGMGSVYLARDPDLDRFVAIKVLREQLFDDELLQRFLREARAAANLRHDNIITIYDVGQQDQQPYMALEYVDGLTVLEIIRNRPPLPVAARLVYVEQICSGLHFAHAAGIVHRDIKPANVMVDRRGIVRVLDFGIARVRGSGMTRDGAMIGTLNYMSPEQMLGRPVDFRSDIFAVGALAYELVTYNKAFPASIDEGLLQKLPYEDPPPMGTFCEGLPAGVEALVFRALAKRPEDRFHDLEEMRLALREARRELDPELALETIVVTASRGGRASSSGRSEHPEFAERRARQIAVHLEAARAALARHDVESATSACEDALTLAPDNSEALALLQEAERARQQRDEQSRARRERERLVRQRLADADLRLSKGDVDGAVHTLEQALSLDPRSATALSLLPRVLEAAAAAGVLVPAALTAADPGSRRDADESHVPPPASVAVVAPTVLAPGREGADSTASRPRSRRARAPLVAAAAAAIAIAAGIVWVVPGSSDVDVAVDAPEPEASRPLLPAAAAPGPFPPVDPPAAAPEPAAPPATEPPRVAAPVRDTSLERQIADVTAIYRRGDLGAALGRIEPLLDTSDDPQVRELAATLAQAAVRTMTAAAAAADVLRSSERAPETYAAATQAKARAEQALAQNRYVDGGRGALVAADGFRQAQLEAKVAAAVPAPPAATRNPPEAAASAVSPVPPADASGSSAASRPAEAAAAAPPAASVVPRDDPGIFALLGRYQEAYRELSLEKLLDIYPRMPRERQQALSGDFKGFRQCDVQFLSPDVRYAAEDPSAATITALVSYTCQPRTRQPAVSFSLDEIFQVRKLGDTWMIQTTGTMDVGRR